MSKFVTISYYKNVSSTSNAVYSNGSVYNPFRITLNVNSIMSIDRTPRQVNTYDSCEHVHCGDSVTQNVYLLETNIGVGHGINGIDFQTFFLTEKSYIHLISFLDPICA